MNIYKYIHIYIYIFIYMIPKIIHQLWIGSNPRPSKFMDTWQTNNPDFEYIYWNEDEIKKFNLNL